VYRQVSGRRAHQAHWPRQTFRWPTRRPGRHVAASSGLAPTSKFRQGSTPAVGARRNITDASSGYFMASGYARTAPSHSAVNLRCESSRIRVEALAVRRVRRRLAHLCSSHRVRRAAGRRQKTEIEARRWLSLRLLSCGPSASITNHMITGSWRIASCWRARPFSPLPCSEDHREEQTPGTDRPLSERRASGRTTGHRPPRTYRTVR